MQTLSSTPPSSSTLDQTTSFLAKGSSLRVKTIFTPAPAVSVLTVHPLCQAEKLGTDTSGARYEQRRVCTPFSEILCKNALGQGQSSLTVFAAVYSKTISQSTLRFVGLETAARTFRPANPIRLVVGPSPGCLKRQKRSPPYAIAAHQPPGANVACSTSRWTPAGGKPSAVRDTSTSPGSFPD